jgi:predicted DNA-binding transcriptional regulator AlpA
VARAEVTKRKPRPKTSSDLRDSWSITEFCDRNTISRSTYYNLKKVNQSPRETRIGVGKRKRVVITRTAAAAWLAKMERQSA